MISKKIIFTLLFCLFCFSIFPTPYNVNISIYPENPDGDDIVSVYISGDWSDSCIPNWVEIENIEDESRFLIEISHDPIPEGCLQVITPFSLGIELDSNPDTNPYYPYDFLSINDPDPLKPGDYIIDIIFIDPRGDTYTYSYDFSVSNIKLDKDSLEVPEEGTAEFEVSLFEDPTMDVQVNITPTPDSDPDIVIESGSVLVFNSENYSYPQIVTLYAEKDTDNNNGEARFEVKIGDLVTASINAKEIDSDYPYIIYVDQNATGANDGSSWQNAFIYLEDARNKALEMSGTEEIKIAGGIYKTKVSTVNGVKYSGCYAGVRYMENPDLQSIFSFPTILSADINGDDGPNFTNREDNESVVVNMSVCDSNTILDGFIISGAEMGGIYLSSGSSSTSDPIITNCIITNNRDREGAGIDIRGGSPIINNCLIIGNSCTYKESNHGGGIYVYGSGTDEVNINNCTIAYNTASDIGGGLQVHTGKINITDSIVWGNVVTLGDSTTNQLATIFDGTIDVSHSCIQDADNLDYINLDDINGNIIDNPEFAINHLGEYFLSNINAQQINSPCIDTGSDYALNLDMNNKTTDTNLNNDTNIVDMGFHYPYYISGGLKGDVDLDNDIDIIDALLIARVYVGIDVDFFIFENADYNGDGKINIVDALGVARYYVGITP